MRLAENQGSLDRNISVKRTTLVKKEEMEGHMEKENES